MDLFFSDPEPEVDLAITMLAVLLSVVISFFIYKKHKNKNNALKVFSLLANLSFILNGGDIFRSYDLIWFGYFCFYIWPIINIMLFVKRKILALFLCSTALNVFFAYVFFDNPPYRLGLFSGILWPATNILLLAYILIKRKRKGG